MFDGARDQSEFLSAWRCRTSFGGHKRLTPFLISRLFAHWCGQPTEGESKLRLGSTETPQTLPIRAHISTLSQRSFILTGLPMAG